MPNTTTTNIKCHENAIHKGSHPEYRIKEFKAVLDGFQC